VTAAELPLARIKANGLVLEPLDDDGLRELAPVIRKPTIFEYGFLGGSSVLPTDDASFVDFMRTALPAYRGGRSFLIREDLGEGEQAPAIGTSSIGNIHRDREVCEIGWTAYDPSSWGTYVNPACKLALLDHAFEYGFSKVVFNVDEMNQRSLGAVDKLGATREGVLRRDRQRPDGTWRNTVTHSILADEWAPIRERLVERLRALGVEA